MAGFQSVFRPGLFAGQAGIVTGAGSGIGRCTAHELAALGARVALVGRKAEKLEAVAREIADAGGSAVCHTCDIREEERVQEVVRAALADFGRIDFLVNNAGGQFGSPLEKISAEGLGRGGAHQPDRRLPDGARVLHAIDEAARRRDREHDRRHVERHARHGAFGRGARRHAQLHRDRRARMGAGARQRGRARMDRLVSGLDQYPAEMAEHIRALPKQVPLGRLGTESEVSAAIVFLLSPAAAFISGSCLRIDGAVPNVKRVLGPDRASGGPDAQPFDGLSSGGEAEGAGVTLPVIQSKIDREATLSSATARTCWS